MNITFPKDEWQYLRERLALGLPIYTTRINDELGKYKLNSCYDAPWGDIMWVSKIISYPSLDVHPFYDELSEKQKAILEGYNGEVLRLVKVYF